MEKRYRVTLLEEERLELQSMVSVGKAAARKIGACPYPPVGGSSRWRSRQGRPANRRCLGLWANDYHTRSQAVCRGWNGGGVESQTDYTGLPEAS